MPSHGIWRRIVPRPNISPLMLWRRFLLGTLLGSVAVPQHAVEAVGQPPLKCASIDEPLAFDNYWVGPKFEGPYLITTRS
jgi:hypothetical protein